MSRFPRIVRRQPSKTSGSTWRMPEPGELLDMLRSYFGLGGAARVEAINTPEALGHFLETRASYMAQTSLYGYLRTRMGMRYPELFDDDAYVVGINIAKWQIWLDCLGDLAVYAGGRIAHMRPREADQVARLISGLVDGILDKAGTPPDAGPEFRAHAGKVRERVARTNFLAVGDREAAFTESPKSVVRWSPIIDNLKRLDEEIVINSVRFHWQEIRRTFKQHLDAQALLEIHEDEHSS